MSANSSAGFYGWKLVGVFFVVYFLTNSFTFYGASVINTQMVLDLGFDRTVLGLGLTVMLLAMGMCSPAIGYCVQRFGVRRTLIGGCLLLVASNLLMSFVISAPWHFVLVFGVIAGIGVGAGGLLPIQAGVTFWFRRRKGLALAIVMSAVGIGSVIAAPLLSRVISASGGNWRLAWLLVSLTSVAAMLVAAIGVRDKPESLGQFPDGIDPSAGAEKAGDSAASRSTVFQSDETWTAAQALRTRSFWLIIAGHTGFLVPTTICTAHGVIHLRDNGAPPDIAALSIGLLVMFSVLGRLLGGFLSDSVEPRKVWCVSLFAVLLGVFVLGSADDVQGVVLYALLFGVGYGSAYVCLPTLIGNYFGSESFPAVYGIEFPIVMLVGAAAPLVAGMVHDAQGSYQLAFDVTMGITLVGAAAIALALPPERA